MNINLSKKGLELIKLYEKMANEGYQREDGSEVKDAFSDFESRFYRNQLKEIISEFKIKSLLDYGCGGSDWNLKGFDEKGLSAKEFYNLENSYRYEPARNIDERRSVDCVICFDVLEHIYIEDIEKIIHDIFSYATKLVIINVACYPAAAILPNGENAHITVRHPHWWKALIDLACLKFPEVSVLLLTSIGWRNTSAFPIQKANDWINSTKFVTLG